MEYRKGVSATVFRDGKVLLFRRKLNWIGWEIMKGGLKGKENPDKALKRELREETGIKSYSCARTDYTYDYRWPREFVKDNHAYHGAHFQLYFIEDLDKTDKIRIDKREHSGYRWVTSKMALKMLTYADQKKALRFVLKNYL